MEVEECDCIGEYEWRLEKRGEGETGMGIRLVEGEGGKEECSGRKNVRREKGIETEGKEDGEEVKKL